MNAERKPRFTNKHLIALIGYNSRSPTDHLENYHTHLPW